MFPFNLPGPEFLALFFVLACAAGWLAWFLRRQWDPEPLASEPIHDPYLLAFLCGGRAHMLRVAVLSLIDRELLQVRGDVLRTAGAGCVEKSSRPLDKAILESYLSPAQAGQMFKHPEILTLAAGYEQQLVEQLLVPDGTLKRRRRLLFGAIALPLLALAVIKIIVAVTHNHYNITFLIILSIVSLIVIFKLSSPFRTRAGTAAVRQARERFVGLKSRGESLRLHELTNELVLLAAVYGMAAVPESVASVMKPIKMYQETSTGSSCGSGCGGGGGGGGCGGGGCGGGCGGCGG